MATPSPQELATFSSSVSINLQVALTWGFDLIHNIIAGKGNKPYISLPKGKGIKLSIAEERDKRLGRS